MQKDREIYPGQFEEYGLQKGLQEILEELTLFCSTQLPTSEIRLSVVLPKEILQRFSTTWIPNQKFNSIRRTLSPTANITSLYSSGGIIDIYEDSKYKVSKKRKKK